MKEAIAANKVDKATWGLIISRKDVGKIKRRLAKLEAQDTEAAWLTWTPVISAATLKPF